MKKLLLILIILTIYPSHHHHHHKVTITVDDNSPSRKLPENKVEKQPKEGENTLEKRPCCSDKVKLAIIVGATTVVSAGISAAVALNSKSCS